MIRTFVVVLGLASLLLASCARAPSPTPTPTARIVVFTASAERTPRNQPVTLIWQAADAGVQDGLPSCLVTRRIDDSPTGSTLQATCAGSADDLPSVPATASTVHYDFQVLKQPYDASDPYVTQTRSIVLDTALYTTRAGGAASDQGLSVSAFPDGGAIVTGYVEGGAAFGTTNLTSAGLSDAFVARIDPNGSWTWARRVGGTAFDAARGVSALPDGSAIVAGVYAGSATFGATTLVSAGGFDAFVARIDPNGAWAWARSAGGPNTDGASGVSALPDGSVIVTGNFEGVANFGATGLFGTGGFDVYVARLDPNGDWTWARRAGGPDTDFPTGVSALADGGAIVTGYFRDSTTFGTTNLTSAGDYDAFVARIGPDGTWTWASRAGGLSREFAHAVSSLADGGAIVTGDFEGTAAFGTTDLTSAGLQDAFVARIDPNGSWTWARRIGATNRDHAYGVSTLANGSAIVTGSFNGTVGFGATDLTSAGPDDLFVARIDADGAWTWAGRGGSNSFGGGRGVDALPDGGALVTGSFAETAAFGTTTIMSAGGIDVVVARIDADGDW